MNYERFKASPATGTLAGFPILTLDIDWAPDFVIDSVAEILIRAGVRATWFVTHDSPGVNRLRHHADLFELGLHPNFMVGSSHGATADQVLQHCAALVPDATCMRTHGLVQSTNLLAQTVRVLSGLQTDLSIFLPRARNAEAHELPIGGRQILRLPYIWEDDVEMTRADPWWSFECFTSVSGLAIFDFHPIHVYMNAQTFGPYEQLKNAETSIATARPDDVPVAAEDGPGPGFLFRNIVNVLVAAGRSYCVRDVSAAARDRSGDGL